MWKCCLVLDNPLIPTDNLQRITAIRVKPMSFESRILFTSHTVSAEMLKITSFHGSEACPAASRLLSVCSATRPRRPAQFLERSSVGSSGAALHVLNFVDLIEPTV